MSGNDYAALHANTLRYVLPTWRYCVQPLFGNLGDYRPPPGGQLRVAPAGAHKHSETDLNSPSLPPRFAPRHNVFAQGLSCQAM
jgi:hypothetical protein